MPIEILPEGSSQWYVASSLNNILFMAIDPFWKTKTGSSDPDDAIIYRGGAGFLQRTTNGGKKWVSILPGTDPPWFDSSDNMWAGVGSPYEPLPRPATDAPSYDHEVTAPTAAQLTYHGYASSKTRSGEHCVLATYELDNAAGYLDQADWNNKLSVAWVLSTFDDWVTHDWQQVLQDTTRGKGTPTASSSTNIYTGGTNPGFNDAVKTGVDLFAVFYTLGSAVYCTMATESGGALVKQNTASQASGVWGTPFADASGNVYIGRVTYEDVGGVNKFFAEVDKWDCSGTTPSRTARYTSSYLPDYSSTNQFGSGYAFYLTPSGRLAFIYYIYDPQGPPYSLDDRMWHWFYFDTSTNVFSTPYKFYDDTAGNGVPWDIDVTAMAIDGGNKCAIAYLENLNWTNRLQDDFFGYTFIMEIGTWTQLDSDQWLNEINTSDTYAITPLSSILYSDSRWAFYHSLDVGFGFNGKEAMMYTYDAVLDTLTRIPYSPSANDGDAGEGNGQRCIRDDTPGVLAFVGEYMHWSDDTLFPSNSVKITAAPSVTLVKCGFGDSTRYVRVVETFSSPNYLIDASIITVPDKPPDDIMSRFGHNPSICYQPDGNRVIVSTPGYLSGPGLMRHWVDRLDREPNSQTGRMDYLDDYDGYQWSYWDGFELTEYENGDTYAGIMPWVDEAPDGVLFFGRLDGVQHPSSPDQIWGWSTAQDYFHIWGSTGLTDPCKAIIDISGRLYAIAQSVTGIKLYEAKAVMADDGQNMVVVSSTPLDDTNYGNVMDVDTLDNTIAIAGGTADPVMVVIAASPWTVWTDVTANHKVDRGVTGLIVIR